LAAAGALSSSGATLGDRAEDERLRAWARRSVALVAAATVVAALYAIVAMLAPRSFRSAGLVDLHWPVRLGFIAGVCASAIVGAAALYLIGRARRRGDAGEWPSWNVMGSTVVCLLLAVVVMVATAVDALFTSHGASVTARFAQASLAFNGFPIAFAALAVVALIAGGGYHERRDGATAPVTLAAGCIGLIAMVAAGYTVWYVPTIPSSSPGFFEGIGWSARVGTICGALASGTLGVAAAYLTRRVRLIEPVVGAADDRELAPTSEQRQDSSDEQHPTRALRPGTLVVGACLALAALCSAALDITQVVDNGPISVGDRLVQVISLVVFTIGLAFAAAVVTIGLPTGRQGNGLKVAVNATVVAVSLATLGLSGYTISHVLFGRDNRQLSFIAHAGAAARVGYIMNAVAIALIAIGALSLLWRARPAPTYDAEGSIATLEPAP